MTYLTEVIKKAGGPTLTMMRKYTLWIKPGSFYHLRIYQLKELKKCPHLMNLDPLKPDLEAPSMTSLRTHETTFEAARKNQQITQEAFEKARDKYADALKLHGHHATSATVRAMVPPKRAAYHWQWRCPTIWIGTSEVTKRVFFLGGYLTHGGGR